MLSSSKSLLAVVLSLASVVAGRAQLKVGDPLPVLESHGLTGGSIPETKGKVVFLDFWASWCAPCKVSFPSYARLQKEFESKGLLVIAVSVDQKAADFASFVKKYQPPFCTLHDIRQSLVRAVKVPTMPTGYLFGRDGRLRGVHQGFHGKTTEDELRERIVELLKEDPSS